MLSPWLAGFLFDPSGQSRALPVDKLPWVAMVMAMGSLLAAGVLIFLRLNVDRPEVQESSVKAAELRTKPA